MTTLDYSPANTALILPFGPYLDDVALELIDNDPANERPDLDYLPEMLGDLLASMRESGLQERVRLYHVDVPGQFPLRYLISSGHRRVAAARALGWATIPAIVESRPADEAAQAVARIASNLCRKDIDPISLARGIGALLAQHPDLTQARVGALLGRSQSAVANALRLLELPEAVVELIAAGKLSAGHGLELLRFTESELNYDGKAVRTAAEVQLTYAKDAVEQGYGVATLRERAKEWHRNQQYRKQDAIRNAKWKAEAEARRAGTPPKALTPEEQAAALAAQAVKDAETAKEQAAKDRETARLASRATTANAVIDATLAYDPAAPNLEVLRLAAAVTVEGAHVRDRDAWYKRIAGAPDSDTLVRIIAAAGRAALQLDSDQRAINSYNLGWELPKWIDARWCFNVRIADALLAAKLIPRNSHTALISGKTQPPVAAAP